MEGPRPKPSRVGLASIWGRAMYLELARVVDTSTRRKSRAPRPTTGGAPRSRAAAVGMTPALHRSHKSHGSQSHARSNAEESLGCPVRTTVLMHTITEAADPLVLPYLTSKPAPGAVAVEAAV